MGHAEPKAVFDVADFLSWDASQTERYEVPLSGGLTLPVVRMTKRLAL